MKTPPKKKPPTRYDNKFQTTWTTTHRHVFIKASRKGEKHAFCEICRSDISIGHAGYYDVTRHIKTSKHESAARAVSNTSSLTMFQPAKVQPSATHAEVLFQGMVIEHNLPLAINDHFSKLVPRMFPDSAIARQYACARTKATHVTYAIAGHSVEQIKKEIGHGNKMFSLATDGSSDEEDKFFPILITHEDQTTGLITTSFLDMPGVNSATGENIAEALRDSLSQCDLSLQQCLSFSSDNASVMTGRHKGVLGYLHQRNKDIYLMGCPCHLSVLAAKTGGKALKSFDPEDFVIDLFYHFDKR